MAHHQYRALIVHQEILQPHHRGQVQVVGGLVQQNHVRVAEQGLGQQHLHLQPGVDLAHQTLMEIHVHPQPLEDAARVALGLPAAQLREFLLQLCGPDAVLIGEVLLVIDGVLLLAAVVEPLVAHDHRVQHRVIIVQALVLLQHRHPLFGRQGHAAGGGLQLAGENFDKGGLARSVGADDAVAVAGGELQVHPGKQHRGAELHGKVIDRKHSILRFYS